MKTAPLLVSNLTKFYGRSRGIEDVSFELKQGEVFGFLGPNGAGKTTTIRVIMDFIRANSGTAKIFGLDSLTDSVAVKRRVGYLAGNIALYDNLTGKQLLSYLVALGEDIDPEYVEELRSRLHADLDRPLKQLSKGNRQKIGLIQAFMHRPELIILDEPTSGLDPLMQEVFYSLVAEHKQAGKTVFVSSHNLSEVQRICDRAAFIREGKLVAIEQVAEVTAIRRFVIQFGRKPTKQWFEGVDGVKYVALEGRTATVTVDGDIAPFLGKVAEHQVVNLDQAQTSLEEVFMRYYQEDES